MPTVSVIIPTHNRSGLLRRALASALCQTFQDIDVIIVDDASTDDTEQVVSAFQDSRVRYVRHSVNQRVSAARNTGVAHSRGAYVAFLDDDDEWLATKLERQVALLGRCAPIVCGVYTGSLNVSAMTGRVNRTARPTLAGKIHPALAEQNWIGTSTVMLRKVCLDAVGPFDTSIGFGEDYDMWIRLAARFEFECIPDALVRVEHQRGGLTADHSIQIKGIEALLVKHSRYFETYPKRYSDRYSHVGLLYCYGGRSGEGRASLRRAVRLYPFQLRCYVLFALSFLGARSFRRVMKLLQEARSLFRSGAAS